jgi:hypothetical protein
MIGSIVGADGGDGGAAAAAAAPKFGGVAAPGESRGASTPDRGGHAPTAAAARGAAARGAAALEGFAPAHDGTPS